MKLKKPKVFKKYFNSFLDPRGFLSAIDLENLEKKLQIKLEYQLVSLSEKKHTFRGFHFQKKPKAQNKIVIVHSGKILDFVVQIDSPLSSQVKSFELTAGEDFNIKDNYNNDFIEVDKKITKHLSKKNKKGLILLHGEPGTGKTTYIKHLADKIEKQIIFVPPMMAGAISDPGFIPFLMKNCQFTSSLNHHP